MFINFLFSLFPFCELSVGVAILTVMFGGGGGDYKYN